MKKKLIDKYGENWFNKHINIKNIYSKKLLYTYEALIKNINERKNIKKNENLISILVIIILHIK